MGVGFKNELLNIGMLLAGVRYLNIGLATGENVERVDHEQEQTYRALMNFALRGREAPQSTLEICSGFGYGAAFVEQEFGIKAHGVDISHVIAAWRRLRGERHYRAFANELPYDAGSVDMVWLVEGLVCLENQEAAIAEMARVLKPGGVLAVAEFRLGKIENAQRRLMQLAGTVGMRVVDFEDKSEAARESALSIAETRAKRLRFIPPPFRKWAWEISAAPGSERHGQWEERKRCYYLAVLEKPE